MRFRTATDSDARLLANLHIASWRSAYRGILTDTFLENGIEADRAVVWALRMEDPRPDQHIVIAESDSGPEGFICLYGEGLPEWGVYVDNLHVRPDGKQRGIGGALLKRGAEWAAKQHPGRGLWLWVYEANENARRFYERLGAENAERTDLPGADGLSAPALRYVWRDLTPLLTYQAAY